MTNDLYEVRRRDSTKTATLQIFAADYALPREAETLTATLAPDSSMSQPSDRRASGEVTHLLRAWSGGDTDAFDSVLPLVYDELHRMAARYLAGERSRVSLQATALVNDVCVRLIGWTPVTWENRAHFFGVSARMMRRVLIDIARRRRADRRGGPHSVHVSLEDVDIPVPAPTADLVALDGALEALALEHPRQARDRRAPLLRRADR